MSRKRKTRRLPKIPTELRTLANNLSIFQGSTIKVANATSKSEVVKTGTR